MQFPFASPGQTHAGEPEKFDFHCSKGIDWLIYSFFYVKFSGEFLYKFELVK